MTEAVATTTTTNTPPPAATETSWYAGFDDETKGYVQNKGLSAKSLSEAFSTVVKMNRDADKFIGAPATEMVRLPKDPNAPEWSNVYKRLGALNAPEEYKFEGVKHSGDKPLSDALTDTLRKAAFSAHLSPDAANVMAKEVVKHYDSTEASRLADQTAKVEAEKKILKDNWGVNGVTNMVVAKNAAVALGIDAEAVEALEKTVGYAKVMEMFRHIGSKIGEDKFISMGGSGGRQPMTKEAAVSEKADLMRDEAWVKRYNAGGVDEKRKMWALNQIITGISA